MESGACRLEGQWEIMLFLSWPALGEGKQQLAGICGLLGSGSLQTEGNPAQSQQIQGIHKGLGSGALCSVGLH